MIKRLIVIFIWGKRKKIRCYKVMRRLWCEYWEILWFTELILWWLRESWKDFERMLGLVSRRFSWELWDDIDERLEQNPKHILITILIGLWWEIWVNTDEKSWRSWIMARKFRWAETIEIKNPRIWVSERNSLSLILKGLWRASRWENH